MHIVYNNTEIARIRHYILMMVRDRDGDEDFWFLERRIIIIDQNVYFT